MIKNEIMTNQRFIGSFEAKTKFSYIISEITDNDINYIITKRGEPVAIIKPYLKEKAEETIDVIKDFMSYRNNKALKLDKSKNISLKNIIHHNHKYYE